MSISSKIEEIALNKSVIKAAIAAKSPKIPPTDELSQWPTSIMSIPPTEGWKKPADWPDIRSILESDVETGYIHKMIILYDRYPDSIYLQGAQKYKANDGSTYTSNGYITPSSLVNGRFRWVIFYTNNESFTYRETSHTGWVYNDYSKMNRSLWVYGDEGAAISRNGSYFWENNVFTQCMDIKLVLSGDNVYNFGGCNFDYVREIDASSSTKLSFSSSKMAVDFGKAHFDSITEFQGEGFSGNISGELHSTSATKIYRLFYQVNNPGFELVHAPSVIDFPSATTCDYLFNNCKSLRQLTDTINLPSLTSQTGAFTNCYCAENLPSHLTINASVSFSTCYGVRDRDSVATFNDVQNPTAVTGGMIGNLNTCTQSGQTITLHSGIKAMFTATEQSLMEATMTAKNWTLAW